MGIDGGREGNKARRQRGKDRDKEGWEERGQEMTGQRQKDGEGRHSSGCLCVCQQEFFPLYSYEDKMFSQGQKE